MTKKTKRDLKNIIIMLAVAGLAYLMLDFLGLISWVLSGQTPEGGFNTGFYFGRISYIIITSLI